MGDEFEQAVLCCFRPGVPQGSEAARSLVVFTELRFADVQSRAQQYLNQVRASPDAWKFCLERYFTTSQVEVKVAIRCALMHVCSSSQFYCLQTLQEIITMGHALDLERS